METTTKKIEIKDMLLERKFQLLENYDCSFSIEFLENKKYKLTILNNTFEAATLGETLANALEYFNYDR